MILQYKHMATPDAEYLINSDPNGEKEIRAQIAEKIADSLLTSCDVQIEMREEHTVRTFEIVTIPPTYYKRLVVLAKKLWYEKGDVAGKEMLQLLQADKLMP